MERFRPQLDDWGVMGAPGSQQHDDRQGPADGPPAERAGGRGPHGATASRSVASPRGGPSQPRPERRRNLAAGLVGAFVVTLLSLIFVASFTGALHNPGPRSAPVGIVGPPVA